MQGDSLTTVKTRSCGCLIGNGLPKTWEVARKHGHASGGCLTPTFRSWSAMHTRCYNPRYDDYPSYGGRGITVCTRWSGKDGFQNFLADMGERPNGTSIDRFPDNDGNYEPGNCRWATRSQQMRNTRASRLTMDLVQEIHGRYEHGEKTASIWRRLIVDPRLIDAVLRGKIWKDAVDGYPAERTSP